MCTKYNLFFFDQRSILACVWGFRSTCSLFIDPRIDYTDDNVLIKRNTRIVVRRMPTRPGKGNAQRYLEGTAPSPQRNFGATARGPATSVNGYEGCVCLSLAWLDVYESFKYFYLSNHLFACLCPFDSSKLRTGESRLDLMQKSHPPPPLITSETSGDANEEEKIQAMFQQSSEFWEKTQELMAA